jgi:hypothetical protein
MEPSHSQFESDLVLQASKTGLELFLPNERSYFKAKECFYKQPAHFKSQFFRGFASCPTFPGLEALFFQGPTKTWSYKVKRFSRFSIAYGGFETFF